MAKTLVFCGAAVALVTLLLFALGWILSVQRRRKLRFGTWVNALGFGLLPALCVGKAFEQYTFLGQGIKVMEPLPGDGWLVPGGRFSPCRIEAILMLIGFAALVIWLFFRKKNLADHGDLLWIALCLWGTTCLIAEQLRALPLYVAAGQSAMAWLALAVMTLSMLHWTVKSKKGEKKAQLWVSWLVFLVGQTALYLTASHTLSVGSDGSDLLLTAGCALLALFGCLTAV